MPYAKITNSLFAMSKTVDVRVDEGSGGGRTYPPCQKQ